MEYEIMGETVKPSSTYINPYTDFGFKKLFGEEGSKDLLIDFLNQLLPPEYKIVELEFRDKEISPEIPEYRKAIFDLYCENEKGEKFIVELQKTKQDFFKDRALYYSTFPIQEQAKKGSLWNFELKAVYTVAILDFIFDEDKKDTDKYKYFVKLSDIETNKVFYDKLTFVYLEMPKFKKPLEEIETHFEKWLYVLRHLNELDKMPVKLTERIFKKLFDVAEIAKFNREQFMQYEDSLKYYWDLKNSLDTKFREGEIKGKIEGKIEIANNLLKMKVEMDVIVAATGLTKVEIEKIQLNQAR
jgi:predicted transposase/invertase (TIGR01784 family)